VHREQLLGHVAQRALHRALGLLPGHAAEAVDARHVAVRARVALHQIEAVHGQEETRIVDVLEAQEFALDTAQLEAHQAAVDADAVLLVTR
jgi:hypothetical protein